MKTIRIPHMTSLQVYDEKSIPGPGWYWHVPTGGIPHQRPRFVEIQDDVLGGELHCKMYQGTYAGPIPMGGLEPKESEEAPSRLQELEHENNVLCAFINREMQMTADDPRIQALRAEIAAGPTCRR